MKVPLTIEYPKAAYHGTPKPIDRPNLVLPPEREPEFLVTRRTTLLSRGRPVSGSDTSGSPATETPRTS
ncbi:MAG: hypothetical protein Q7S40_25220 [Opitutaceae bacterium]|nr:hypothetical protein [Opitutaceae bacterium]